MSGIAAGIQLVTIPEGFPSGWDLADAQAEGWTPEQTIEWLNHHVEPPRSKGLFPLDDARIGEWIVKTPPPRRWLVVKVIPLGKVCLLVAPGGTGKSFFVVSLAISVASGLPVFGELQTGETGGVLLLFAEEDREELHRRFHNVINTTLADTENPEHFHRLISNRVFARSMTGQNNLMTAKTGQEVTQTDYVDRLIETAREIPNLKLIVVDPASRFRGGEENLSEDTTRFVESLERVAQETGATILVVHHSNKASMQQGASTSQAAARGSSAFTDGVRWQGDLSVLNEKDARSFDIKPDERKQYVRFAITKSNYSPPSNDIWLKRGDHGVLRMVELSSKKAAENEAVLSQVVQIIRERAEHGNEYSRRRFEDRFSGKAGELGVSKHQLRNIIDNALETDLLTQRPPKVPEKNVPLVLAVPDPDGIQDDEILEVI
ncbi:MAG: AAA family ATPase [Magnetococcales bacterium]|nr:AAA family ATPase [Magnetococcales bacterium]